MKKITLILIAVLIAYTSYSQNERAATFSGTGLSDSTAYEIRTPAQLARFRDDIRLVPSTFGPDGGDIGNKDRQLGNNPALKFIIITNPQTFPY